MTLGVVEGQSVEMAFRSIPAGTFRMGSRGEYHDEAPAHLVTISQEFWIAETPVTQRQFAAWTGSGDYEPWCRQRKQDDRHENWFKLGRVGAGVAAALRDHPAENLTWDEADGFCKWLTDRRPAGLPAKWTVALPTEAQWEYCCRAGRDTEYGLGDGVGVLDEMGWFDGNSGNRTHAVGEKCPNAWNLYDMHGNVWEWCADASDAEAYKREGRYDGCVDPEVLAAAGGGRIPVRVVRGGSWLHTAWFCRSAYRYWWRPGYRYHILGFRCCLFPGPVAKP